MKRVIILITFLFSSTFLEPVLVVKGAAQDQISVYQQQIDQIQKQIDQYQQQIDANENVAQTLTSEINSLNDQINKVQLEIKSLGLEINQTTAQINATQTQITDAQNKIDLDQQALAKYMQTLYELDQESLTEVIFRNTRLSDFFGNLKNLEDVQTNVKTTMVNIEDLKAALEQNESNLQDQKSQYQTLQSLQQSEKSDLDQTKKQKNNLLLQTKGKEVNFQKLVKQSQSDISRIRDQITYLEQNGVSVDDAIKFGELAAIRVGIRPAFLIAELEVESGIGVNVGKCNQPGDPPEKNWRAIMNPRDFDPFTTITSALGLNPDITPVSCPQYVNGRRYGWGGAMGPAQFIPSTWLGYADKVAQLVGKPMANPWNIEDAFMAAAVKLANAGAAAKTASAEIAASKAYYSGKPNCYTSVCRSYANAVQNKAAIIEQNL